MVSARISLQEKHPDHPPDTNPPPGALAGRGASFVSPQSSAVPTTRLQQRGGNPAAPMGLESTQGRGTAFSNGKAVGEGLGKVADAVGCARLFNKSHCL